MRRVTTVILILLIPLSVYSHGTGGGNISIKLPDEKKHDRINKMPVSEKLIFRLEIKEKSVKLWIKDKNGQPVDTGLASANVVRSDNGKVSFFSMGPSENGFISGSLSSKLSGSEKLDIILRMPGERPFNLTFKPNTSQQPVKMSQ